MRTTFDNNSLIRCLMCREWRPQLTIIVSWIFFLQFLRRGNVSSRCCTSHLYHCIQQLKCYLFFFSFSIGEEPFSSFEEQKCNQNILEYFEKTKTFEQNKICRILLKILTLIIQCLRCVQHVIHSGCEQSCLESLNPSLLFSIQRNFSVFQFIQNHHSSV